MKLRHLILTGTLAGLAYSIYKNREDIQQTLTNLQKNKTLAQDNLANIKDNLGIIEDQLQLIQTYQKDLTQKWRYFDQEKEARLAEIKRTWEASPLTKSE